MNAMPMFERCAEAQWRGLPWADRALLDLFWTSEGIVSGAALHKTAVTQRNIPLWRVAFKSGGGLDLVSVKTEYLGDVP